MQGVTKLIGAEDDPEMKMEIKAYTDILNGVKEQPTIEPEPQWIPITERLPKNSRAWRTGYLATVFCASWKEKKTMYVEWENATIKGKAVSRWIWNGKLFPKEWEIIAWIPLPEPYKEEK